MGNDIDPSSEPQTPKGTLTGAELKALELAAGMAAKYGPAMGKAAYEAWNGKEPIVVQVVDAWTEDEYFNAELWITSISSHSVYIEDWKLTDPSKAEFELASFHESASDNFGGGAGIEYMSPEDYLPIRIRPDAAAPVRILVR